MIKGVTINMNKKRRGYMITIDLDEFGYADYSVDCIYKYNKQKNKYILSMWLTWNTVDDRFKIDSQEIDTQLITSEKDNIEDNICRIVEQASKTGFFDRYIERYEYTYKCFNRGNELYEQEYLNTLKNSD